MSTRITTAPLIDDRAPATSAAERRQLVLGIGVGLAAAGIGVVMGGLLLLSGVDAARFTGRVALGDAMFVAAGTLRAGFGILLRRHRLDPLVATAVVSASALLTDIPKLM
jgi:hypothetical protein